MPLNFQHQGTDGARLRLEASLRDVGPAAPRGLGCSACPDLGTCGGLHLEKGFWDCRDLCCGSPQSCKGRMCRFKVADYAQRHAEIGGFSLNRIPPAMHHPAVPLPVVVPMIYHGKRREISFAAPVVAVRLRDLYFKRSGIPRFATRSDFLQHFRLAETCRIIASGIDNDDQVERWWGLAEKRAAVMHNLKHVLEIEMLTVPNFSLAVSWPRWSDLYSVKRIGLAWEELCNAGLPTALHTNGRTEQDFDHWQQFVVGHPEVNRLSFEFTTGAGSPGAREKYAARLIALARAANRPMHLIVTGGQAVWPMLAAAFETLTVVETSIFMKTQHRQRAVPGGNRGMRYERVITAPGASLDELFEANARVITACVEQLARPVQVTRM